MIRTSSLGCLAYIVFIVSGCASTPKPAHPDGATVNRALVAVAESNRQSVEFPPAGSWMVVVGKADDLPQGASIISRNLGTCSTETAPTCADMLSSMQMSYLTQVVCTDWKTKPGTILMPVYKRDKNGCWQSVGDYTGHPTMPMGFAPDEPSRGPDAFGADSKERHVVAIYK